MTKLIMKFGWNGGRRKGDRRVTEVETGETNGPFISQNPLNASFMKSSVNMGYELKDHRSTLGNGRVFNVHVTVHCNEFLYNKTN